MKKLVAPIALGLSLLIASPAFAYEVKSGDTMSKIAKENRLTLPELSELNPQVTNLDLIRVGQNINVNTKAESTANSFTSTVKITASEKDLLARLVRAEAESESYAGKVAVAVVVLNRMDSQDFPDTVSAVINQRGQFSPVTNGAINRPADADSIKAVNQALAMDRSGDESLFFYNSAIAVSRWLDTKETVKVIGNHTFKK